MACWLFWLAVESLWLALTGSILSFLEQMGIETTPFPFLAL